MRHSLLVRIKAFFARDKYSFWWNELTDRDKKLAALSTRGLAGKLQDASTLRDAEEVIVIEHMLSQRLAEIQTKAAWGASILGFVWAILGASLSVALTEMLNDKNECITASTNNHSGQQVKSRPIQVDAAKPPSGSAVDIPIKNHEQGK
ncbi:MAG TPA: hypothetical protein DHV67_03185 [Gallionella sp.]|nr:hypothetical protein [Gallionella sp.]